MHKWETRVSFCELFFVFFFVLRWLCCMPHRKTKLMRASFLPDSIWMLHGRKLAIAICLNCSETTYSIRWLIVDNHGWIMHTSFNVSINWMLAQWKRYFFVHISISNMDGILMPTFNVQVQLMSRDEQSILIVTYAELKHCLEQAFTDLTAAT